MKLANFVKFREEKFGGVLFETRSEKVFTLNPTASAVVREIEQGGEQSDIIERLTQRFDGQIDTIGIEAGAFIAELLEKGLVKE